MKIKKLYFLLVAMVLGGVLSSAAVTVYFEKPNGWNSVYAYCFGGDGEYKAWPGEEVTETLQARHYNSNSDVTLYKYEIPGNRATIIFNNNAGTQTGNLSIIDGNVYVYNQDSNPNKISDYLLNTGDLVTIEGDYNIAYYGNHTQIYYWGTGVSSPSNFWQSPAMEIVTGSDGNSYKVYKLPEGTEKVMFLTATSSSGGTQTAEGGMTYTEGYVFNNTGATSKQVTFKLPVTEVFQSWSYSTDGGATKTEMTPSGNNYTASTALTAGNTVTFYRNVTVDGVAQTTQYGVNAAHDYVLHTGFVDIDANSALVETTEYGVKTLMEGDFSFTITENGAEGSTITSTSSDLKVNTYTIYYTGSSSDPMLNLWDGKGSNTTGYSSIFVTDNAKGTNALSCDATTGTDALGNTYHKYTFTTYDDASLGGWKVKIPSTNDKEQEFVNGAAYTSSTVTPGYNPDFEVATVYIPYLDWEWASGARMVYGGNTVDLTRETMNGVEYWTTKIVPANYAWKLQRTNASAYDTNSVELTSTFQSGEYVYRLDGSVVSLQEAPAQSTYTYDYYIHGDFNADNTWATDELQKMVLNETSGTYSTTVDFAGERQLGIRRYIPGVDTAGGESAWINAVNDAVATRDVAYAVGVMASNFNIKVASGKHTFTFDPSAMTVTISEYKESFVPDANYPATMVSGSLPVMHITVYNDSTFTTLNGDMLNKDYVDKTYHSCATYYLTVPENYKLDTNGTIGEGVGSVDNQLPLEIKLRGNYTRTGFSKKPYKIKLGAKQGLLGMTKSKHFALLAHADDNQGFMRNFVGFTLGKLIGLPWTPSQQPVELVINGEYRGLYFLTESIRVGDDRIMITELDDNVSESGLISGGYLVELDNYPDDPVIKLTDAKDQPVWVTPDTPEKYSTSQLRFVNDQFTAMNNQVTNINNSQSHNLWSYMDLDDAARYYMVKELIDDFESYHGSTYLFRDHGENQRWHFSPLWDCGSAFRRDNQKQFIWDTDVAGAGDGISHYGNTWIPIIYNDAQFQTKVKETWKWFMNSGYTQLKDQMDFYTAQISTAAVKDDLRWKDAPTPEPANGNNPTAVKTNPDIASDYGNVKGMIDEKITFLNGKWGDYTKATDEEKKEPARDTTAAVALPDYAKPGYVETTPVIYFTNPDGWNPPYVHAWNANNSNANCTAKGSWPGDQMVQLDNGYWAWYLPEGKETPTHIIFSNNGASQTGDLDFEDKALYNKEGIEVHNYNPNPLEPEDLKAWYYSIDGGTSKYTMTKSSDGITWSIDLEMTSGQKITFYRNNTQFAPESGADYGLNSSWTAIPENQALVGSSYGVTVAMDGKFSFYITEGNVTDSKIRSEYTYVETWHYEVPGFGKTKIEANTATSWQFKYKAVNGSQMRFYCGSVQYCYPADNNEYWITTPGADGVYADKTMEQNSKYLVFKNEDNLLITIYKITGGYNLKIETQPTDATWPGAEERASYPTTVKRDNIVVITPDPNFAGKPYCVEFEYTAPTSLYSQKLTAKHTYDGSEDGEFIWVKYEDNTWDGTNGASLDPADALYLSDTDLYDAEPRTATLASSHYMANYATFAELLASRTHTVSHSTEGVHTPRNFTQAYYRAYGVHKTSPIDVQIETMSKSTKGRMLKSIVDSQSIGNYGARVAFTMSIPENTTGVNDIEADDMLNGMDAEPVYYNLQGVQVTNPAPGQIYIVRRGNTVTKELLR